MALGRWIDQIFKHEAAGGIMLMLSAALAMIVANSSGFMAYDNFLNAKLSVTVNDTGLEKPLVLWINDGLMAIFFFLVGLELKKEMLEGKLRNPSDVLLPGMAAVGGMVVPALIFAAFNFSSPETLNGWAIPAATDIAFALGVLALLGDRVPSSLKIFLLTLAILDDLGAIIIIALFYTADLKVNYLLGAFIPFAGMLMLNMRRVHRVAPMLLLGAIMWVLVLKSGVHATLAGVITALLIPLKDRWGASPLHSLEHALTPYVYFVIVPLFAFANAGVVLEGMSFGDILAPLPLGIALGLFLGKQIGVFGVTRAMVALGFAKKPAGSTWLQIYGIACLAGIGFTMSLFIGSLSFTDQTYMNEVRVGVLGGSVISAIVGFIALRMSTEKAPKAQAAAA